MSKVKWGVIGSGGIARRRTIPEGIVAGSNSELVAVMDVDPKVNAEVAAEFSAATCGTEAELLADASVQAVYIATPVGLHKTQVLAALAAGKHVLLEKPLAGTQEDCAAIVAAAKAAQGNGVFLTEGYMMGFHPLHQHAKQIIADGKIGTPVFARAQLSCWYPPIDGAWRQNRSAGGGSLMDLGTHCFDLLIKLFGSVRSVSACIGSLVHDYETEDSSVALLEFANGTQAVVDAFFNITDAGCKRRLEVYGSGGSILADGTIGQGGGTMEVCISDPDAAYDAAQQREEAAFRPVDPGEFNMYRREVEYLSQCILEGKAPTLNTAAEGLAVLKVAWAAYESAATGKRVDLPGDPARQSESGRDTRDRARPAVPGDTL